MMQAWADYVDKLKASGRVIPFRRHGVTYVLPVEQWHSYGMRQAVVVGMAQADMSLCAGAGPSSTEHESNRTKTHNSYTTSGDAIRSWLAVVAKPRWPFPNPVRPPCQGGNFSTSCGHYQTKLRFCKH
jgi:hypothetical protein